MSKKTEVSKYWNRSLRYRKWSAINSSGDLVLRTPHVGIDYCRWQMELCANTKHRHQQIYFETSIPRTVWEVRELLMLSWDKPRLMPWIGEDNYTNKKASVGPENKDNHNLMTDRFSSWPLEEPTVWENYSDCTNPRYIIFCTWIEKYRTLGFARCEKFKVFYSKLDSIHQYDMLPEDQKAP